MFPFVIPWDDASAGTVTNVSHLNPGPAGSEGFLVSRDGQFIASDTGRRIRFVATNLTAGAAFPTAEDAERIAARMAKLRHQPRPLSPPPEQLGRRRRDHLVARPALLRRGSEPLDKIDAFFAALKGTGSTPT